MKKTIGISFTRTNFQYYWDWFTKEDLGDSMELLELSFEKNNSEDITICDGFILTGGIDVDPSLYGGASQYAHQPPVFESERDRFETAIFQYAQDHHLPLLAICRGLQLVNVLQGGKLTQDLRADNETHKNEGKVDKQHTIQVSPGSLLYEITGSTTGEVNSAHHQAVQPGALGENLVINAWSEKDSVIEGLEFKNKTGTAFMLCVQWHPERMQDKETNPFSGKLKEKFIEAVKKSTAT